MNVKYQVFISSTYRDLVDARLKVFESLMSRHVYIPVGMENFEASDRPSWDLIKQRIDECDYMLVIVGDQAGSLGPEGVPFTEMEYDYARKKKVPVAVLLKSNISPSASTPREVENARLVLAFRDKCMRDKNIKPWSEIADLANHAAGAVEAMVRTSPRSGWIRADEAPTSLPFNLGKDKPPYRLAGKWLGYFVEDDGNGPRLIEEEVKIRQEGSIFSGTHKCLSEKRGLFHLRGYFRDDVLAAIFSFYEDKFEDGGIYNLVASRQGNWLEGFVTWKAWPAGRIDSSRYILHRAGTTESDQHRTEALERMSMEVKKLKPETLP